ncbi:hypothetical protein EDC96DRAFT_579018 [Choanephora cucurbitarum]|nr:hypothetical protein EDC96DRAFT_579018 [Choanephora cucurbitarum]
MDSGVRAEPKFLRDPTSLESISSGISKLSNYVASNLPRRKSSHIMTSPFDLYYQQQMIDTMAEDNTLPHEDLEEMDTITFGIFDQLEHQERHISCLLLGYQDGFQIWDITNPDNVHEICSVRDKDAFGTVSLMHIIQSTQTVAIVSTLEDTKKSRLLFYSLKAQKVMKEMDEFFSEDDDTMTTVTCIKSNHKVIALGCSSPQRSSIHLLSTSDYSLFARPLTDVFHDERGPVFSLGSRFIAYATNTAVLNSDPVMTSLTNKSIGYTGFGVLQGEKDVKGAAKDIAKEVVSGMKTLGEFGLNTLSNYFGNTPTTSTSSSDKLMFTPSSPKRSNHHHHQASSLSDTLYPSNNMSNKKMIPSGMIMIRDILKLPITPTRNLSSSIVAHFRPHTHPVSCLTFNQAGTLLMSASKQGHTFHIFSILTYTTSASHLYSLSRGITDAQVEDCQFSVDSTWCAISTARGTTHVYAINPYGGKPEISGHVHGKVSNPFVPKPQRRSTAIKATTLSSVVRIKQRRKMPGYLQSQDDLTGKYGGNTPNSYGYYGPTPPHYVPMMISRPSTTANSTQTSKEPRAKLTTMFVSATKSPYLVNTNTAPASSSDPSSSSPSFSSIKQQASNMLSSFNLPYLPQQPQQHTNRSNNDTLMFGFDEEYDDAAKMINDEIGYQDMYSFHPDGFLTLHRCWVAKTVIKKRENGRMLEKLDLSLKEEDVAEWRVARNSEWDTVRFSLLDLPTSQEEEEPQKKTKKKHNSSKHRAPMKEKEEISTLPVISPKRIWLSNAEIATYMPDEPPLWSHHQFSFQTYQSGQDVDSMLAAGILPSTDTIIMLKGMPEPVSSRIDRVSKTTTRIANDSVEENMEDALAELEDNISKAMQTSFSPSNNSVGNSPATNLKWLSSSANAIHVSPHQRNMDRNSSVSFEDAYLIHMGSGPSPEPSSHLGLTPIQNRHLEDEDEIQTSVMQHSSLIQFDDDDDDLSVEQMESNRMEAYSPDGDNEVEYPYESVFGELHTRISNPDESDEDDQVPW